MAGIAGALEERHRLAHDSHTSIVVYNIFLVLQGSKADGDHLMKDAQHGEVWCVVDGLSCHCLANCLHCLALFALCL